MTTQTEQVALDGFGTSLVGNYFCMLYPAPDTPQWIPYEFLIDYETRILVEGSRSGRRHLHCSEQWSSIWYPKTVKEWSCLATLIKNSSGTTLLSIDNISIEEIPASFLKFIESQKVTVCIHQELAAIQSFIVEHLSNNIRLPDAVFFPPIDEDEDIAGGIQMAIESIPTRGTDGTRLVRRWNPHKYHVGEISQHLQTDMAIVLSDVSEPNWTLFWYRRGDSIVSDAVKEDPRIWLKTAVDLL